MAKALDLDDVADGHYLAVQELAALRKDAERYRWLRGDPPKTEYAFWVEVSAGCYLDGDELDAAIDAAMRTRGAVGAA